MAAVTLAVILDAVVAPYVLSLVFPVVAIAAATAGTVTVDHWCFIAIDVQNVVDILVEVSLLPCHVSSCMAVRHLE